MKKITLFTAVFVFLLAVNLFAEGTIKAEINKTSLTTDETLTYKITITAFGNELPEAHPPKFEDFNIISSLQSSTMSFAKNKIKRIIIYEFILRPKNVGKINIEPSSVEIEKEVYSSDVFVIEVKPAKEALPESGEPKTTL